MEELLKYLKEQKEYLTDYSGCGSDREINIQTGKEEMIDDILEFISKCSKTV